MTAKVSTYKDSLYSRDYANDVPEQSNLFKRIGMAALPFLSLNPSLRPGISLVMDSCRIWNAESVFQKVVAIISLVGSVLKYRTGMVLTTLQDIYLELQRMRGAKSWEEGSKSLIKILNHLTYLALISKGGLELSILAFAIQAIQNMIASRDEFKKGRWIEGCANLLMATIRMKQAYGQYQELERKREIEAIVKRIQVGDLHEKWRFPSDHLPVGIEVNGVRIMSWNVLNNAYMEWVTDKDSQGLKGSLISELDVAINDQGLTKRDVLVADMVQNMISKGQMVALQECGEPFLQHLQQKLPSHWGIVKSYPSVEEDQEVILYDKNKLTYDPDRSETNFDAYPSIPRRPVQNAFFSLKEGQDLRIINGHIPGDPDKPCREEFAHYVRQQHQEGATTVALGDNNFEREEMLAAYQKAGFEDFSLHSPWKTNIDPWPALGKEKESKAIDHLFVIGEENSRDLMSQEILDQQYHLQDTIDLINRPKM